MLKPIATSLLYISRGVKTAPPTSTARAFDKKKLNRENKILFGDLLETQQERRKKIENNNFEEPKKELKDSEQKWHAKFSKAGSQFQIKVLSPATGKIAFNQACEKDTSVVNVKKQTDWNLKHAPEDVNHQIASYNEPSSTKFKKIKNVQKVKTTTENPEIQNSPASKNETALIKPTRTTSSTSLLLPDSVIRNITSFPMLNMKKSEHVEPVATSKDSLRLYPSVSKVLNATMSDASRAALKRWRTKLIEQLGEDGFLRFNRGQLQRGTQFHSLVQNHLSGQPPAETLDPELEGCWSSLAHVLPHVSSVMALESPILHSQLLYRGVLDCVASFNDEPVVIEWKKSDRPKPLLQNTYDAPLQMTAYLGAMNFDPSYNFKVNGGVVVVAYSDGSPAEAFHLTLADCTPHWRAWLARLQQFWLLQQQAAATLDQSV